MVTSSGERTLGTLRIRKRTEDLQEAWQKFQEVLGHHPLQVDQPYQ